jgi:hypothetical protein
MTVDERLQFLVQSTESLHASIQERHAIVSEHTKQLKLPTKQLATNAAAIRNLARIAEAHENRLTDHRGR